MRDDYIASPALYIHWTSDWSIYSGPIWDIIQPKTAPRLRAILRTRGRIFRGLAPEIERDHFERQYPWPRDGITDVVLHRRDSISLSLSIW